MSQFSYVRTIRETDLDFLGHVNHAVYLSMMEEARWEMMTENGYSFDELRAAMIAPVILGVDIQYQKEIGNRECITIETHTQANPSKVGTLQHTVRKENGQVAAIATITYGVMDLNTRKLIHPPSFWFQAIGVEKTAIGKS